ncbi:hypothetical protein MON38_02815 [Hymenobacter sp. DH14]|uniref:FTP domain-containing protein n=1 Tax=Hymenobacter cyanobacteriorum TaxID=2926463 RepID=A0A9X2ADN8_9BACT|nr:hypothetical protein [Hymenobacter cyanobacteriorum]MCI1186336.1 hypothetical protein [Hymenobacter cyanobacteriorum]
MLRILLIILSLSHGYVSVAQTILEQKNDSISVSNNPPMIMSNYIKFPTPYKYNPETIKSITDLPDNVRAKVEPYLVDRLGVNFYKSLRFINGQKFSLNNLDSARIGIKDYRFPLATYYLQYVCLETKSESGYFKAGASFDSDGIVVDSINLPKFTNYFNHQKLISVHKAINIARHSWSDEFKENPNWIRRQNVSLDYSPLNNCFVWWFSKTKSEGPGKSHLRRIFINASTGNVLRTRNSTHKYAPF